MVTSRSRAERQACISDIFILTSPLSKFYQLYFQNMTQIWPLFPFSAWLCFYHFSSHHQFSTYCTVLQIGCPSSSLPSYGLIYTTQVLWKYQTCHFSVQVLSRLPNWCHVKSKCLTVTYQVLHYLRLCICLSLYLELLSPRISIACFCLLLGFYTNVTLLTCFLSPPCIKYYLPTRPFPTYIFIVLIITWHLTFCWFFSSVSNIKV